MNSSENILYILKRSLLEYALKNKIEYLIQKFANENINFDQYNIGTIRFELYNLYITVKHKRIDLFQPLIEFLIEFQTYYENIIEEKLYFRVLFALQALYIYNSLKNDDLKTTSKLIKEYFPKEITQQKIPNNSSQNTEKKKSTREVQILKLRSEWNELLLSKSKRAAFFETKFKAQYDDSFFEFLLVKTNAIIDVINKKLPLTQLEEIMGARCLQMQFNISLFNLNTLEIKDEDEIRIELFIDNLNLHKICLESNPPDVRPSYCTKYIRKIYKNLEEWQAQLNDADSQELIATQENTQPSQNKNRKSIVHEFLYMDSQFDYIHLNEGETEMDFQSTTDSDKLPSSEMEKEQLIRTPVISVRMLNPDITNDLSKSSNVTNDLTKITNVTNSNTTSSFKNAAESFESFHDSELVLTGSRLKVKTYETRSKAKAADLLTDDERD